MTGKRRFERAAGSQADRKQSKVIYFSGLLGITTLGEAQVEVAGRNGFVWVRLRNQLNETIQAYNTSVSPVYDLPVQVAWDQFSPNRYTIVGRDIGRYADWGSVSTYEPVHGQQHSFNPTIGAAGGDITWVYDQQFMPFLVTPSGSAGAMSVSWQPDVYYASGIFNYWGGTGLAVPASLKPVTADKARVYLIYCDVTSGNPMIATGSMTEFDAAITGTAGVMLYMPSLVDADDIPLAGLRLVTGTSTILWPNLYDVRQIISSG